MNFEQPLITDLHNAALSQRLQHLIDHKTKPLGALGQLESLAHQIGLILRSEQPALQQPQMVVFAADHGLAARGVSAYPSDVTWQMVENFLAGGAAVSVLARQHGLALTVVDAGVAHDFTPCSGLEIRKVARGTADCTTQPAMTHEQMSEALWHGQDLVRSLPGNTILLGEMGIGNTSSAALLMACLTGESIEACTGRGTGLDDAGLTRKLAILNEALTCHAAVTEPLDALAAFGGFEIAEMVGAILQAAAENRVILVDGFITTSAVLVASRLQPLVLQRCVFAHQSDESGHARMLAHLGVHALLKLRLRLGEGSGAALAWPLLESACRILREMASFEAAGVSVSEHDAGQAPQQ
ncbi:MAG: nicotinate-nucleotide--dimethylbenzimidazole phosphoribosyltransferase [Aquabacterium sp.]|jgi:nicotinate-nucleotide--dimethylbenzimidazole phosphoribosyltransferase|uniref:nicotinate-nucleotide--dimethylbenzimidazole phosphoribosyltransferase n=1 Tax=Aquabacterium sp. TaxID=1872578 RepID=UPI001B5BDDF8|nr:nicotinate-nucleotide--dimethylbenzimidazole phosphoribosyltransferase [Aquabacterium sp.]MBP7131687.1 nicotinate-nucleotide--dimethylbenzimidazole phosphoribosyltransferase [Aquabacterium sp.]MDQ5926181.1 nicotinate-nucleotide--dimethylbenzimidazole phosphoribosyltransferase [Pseudomonadota bacterium]